MTIAIERGWSETNRPTCVACMNPIGVRGEKEVAVLGALVIEATGETPWLAHFLCRRIDWWYASKTDDPTVRQLPHVTLKILTDQLRWLDDPQVRYSKVEKHDVPWKNVPGEAGPQFHR